MVDVIEAEFRVECMLRDLGYLDAGASGADPHETFGAGDAVVSWPLRFVTRGCRARCSARVYERFNGSVVLCIDCEVAEMDDSHHLRRWVTTSTGWMPFVQARLDRRSDGRVIVTATHSLLAEDVTPGSLEQVIGSIDYVVPKWIGNLGDLGRNGGDDSCLLVADLDDLEIDDQDMEDHHIEEDLFGGDSSTSPARPGVDARASAGTPSSGTAAEGIEGALADLESLVGLESVKSLVRQLVATHDVARRRRVQGLRVLEPSPHLVLVGNPGTGKTTVARCLGRIYRELGLLSTGHVVEVDRAGLVAGYVGQTAIKTRQALDAAAGGILFIDEAYSLIGDSIHDYGPEAVETILARMENQRGDVVVVAAGYPRQMEQFLTSNPGLASRFDRTVEFPDYGDDELVRIFGDLCTAHDYGLSDGALAALRTTVSGWVRGHGFGNAREVRRLFHQVVGSHSQWAVENGVMSGTGLGVLDAVHFPPVPGGSVHHSSPARRRTVPGYL